MGCESGFKLFDPEHREYKKTSAEAFGGTFPRDGTHAMRERGRRRVVVHDVMGVVRTVPMFTAARRGAAQTLTAHACKVASYAARHTELEGGTLWFAADGGGVSKARGVTHTGRGYTRTEEPLAWGYEQHSFRCDFPPSQNIYKDGLMRCRSAFVYPLVVATCDFLREAYTPGFGDGRVACVWGPTRSTFARRAPPALRVVRTVLGEPEPLRAIPDADPELCRGVRLELALRAPLERAWPRTEDNLRYVALREAVLVTAARLVGSPLDTAVCALSSGRGVAAYDDASVELFGQIAGALSDPMAAGALEGASREGVLEVCVALFVRLCKLPPPVPAFREIYKVHAERGAGAVRAMLDRHNEADSAVQCVAHISRGADVDIVTGDSDAIVEACIREACLRPDRGGDVRVWLPIQKRAPVPFLASACLAHLDKMYASIARKDASGSLHERLSMLLLLVAPGNDLVQHTTNGVALLGKMQRRPLTSMLCAESLECRRAVIVQILEVVWWRAKLEKLRAEGPGNPCAANVAQCALYLHTVLSYHLPERSDEPDPFRTEAAAQGGDHSCVRGSCGGGQLSVYGYWVDAGGESQRSKGVCVHMSPAPRFVVPEAMVGFKRPREDIDDGHDGVKRARP